MHLRKLPNAPSDRDRFSLSWSLSDAERTRIGLEFSADVSFLPSLLPMPGVGDLIARAVLGAATRELGRSRSPGARASSS